MFKYALHKDFKLLNFVTFDIRSPILRFLFNIYTTVTFLLVSNKKIETKKFKVTSGYNPEKKVRCEIYRPKELSGKKIPCVIYTHGGGFGLKGAGHHKTLMHMYALQANCAVAYIEYSRIPKHGCPTAFFESMNLVFAVKDMDDIDISKIVLAGDSAGGCLAASMAQYITEYPWIKPSDKIFKIVGQMLVYPVLDHTMNTESNKKFTDTPVWNSKLSEYMWDTLLLGMNEEDISGFVSPAQGNITRELPEAYVETTEFDCLHDEGVAYANALIAAEVPVTYHSPNGTCHAYDLVKSSEITKDSIRRRVEFLNKVFSK